MHKFVVLILFSAVLVWAQDSAHPPVVEITPQPPSNMSTTIAPTTKPTDPTTKPTDPTTKPTDPTTKPTAPTTKPTTPTTKPTTPTTKPTEPSTTTSKPTAPPTTPSPPPPPKSWIVYGENGTVCIVANMELHLSISYTKSDKKNANSDFWLRNLGNATASGTCAPGKDNQTLVLTWQNIVSTFTFDKSTSNKTYTLNSVELKVPVNNGTFPNNTMSGNASSLVLNYNKELFSVPLNQSYSCASMEPLKLNSTASGTNSTFTGTLTISKARLEAFGATNKTEYSAAQDCALLTPDIVPIVVGLVLAGLVVIVLVAYLVGRHRNQARGYLSM